MNAICWWRRRSVAFSVFLWYPIYAWDVKNKWLIISLIWISGCRQMKDYIRRLRKHSGFRTNETYHGWQQRLLCWHQTQCNWTFLHGITSLQNMWKMDNLRMWCSFSNKCDEKELVLTNSLLFRHVLVKEHSKMADLFINSSFKVWCLCGE